MTTPVTAFRRVRVSTVLFLGSLIVGTGCFLTACRDRSESPPVTARPRESSAAALPMDRAGWQLDTLVGDYLRIGKRSPKWDQAATNLLSLFAAERTLHTNVVPGSLGAYSNAVEAVRAAGCSDPMVNYVVVRYLHGLPGDPSAEVVEAYRSVARELDASGYAAVRKFYATLRASFAVKLQAGTNTPPEVLGLRERLAMHLKAMAQDPRTPLEDLCEAGQDLLDALRNNDPLVEKLMSPLESVLFDGRPESKLLLLLRGEYEIRRAWAARGSGYANTVTDDGWRGFEKHLNLAEAALSRAWELAPQEEQAARRMITVCLGLNKPRSEMERWFGRAMEADPSNYAACSAKRNYLEPKWYGSPEEMIEFGRECVQSPKWGGRVPLILVDTHEALAKYIRDAEGKKNYWRQSEVWSDIQSSFEKFFRLNPQETGWRHNYAFWAYRCEAWDTLNAQLPLLGEVNYEYFGGREAFDQMVRAAKEHARSVPRSGSGDAER